MVCADLSFPVTVGRVDAYRRALEDAGLTVAPEYIVPGDWKFETPVECGQPWFHSRKFMADPEYTPFVVEKLTV